MENKNKIRWGLIIAVLFVICLAVDYFFLHILFQKKFEMLKQNREQVQATTDKAQKPNLPSDTQEISYHEPTQNPVPNSKFQEVAVQCLGSELGKNPTPDDLVKDLEKNNPVINSQFQLENTQIQLPDGSERRLHMIVADSTQNKRSIELRYFKLDAEGLPERIQLKPEQTMNPRPEFVTSLKNQGKVIYHQLKETKKLKDGASMILTTVNNKTYEFQIFSNGKTFSCRELSCICR